MRVLAADVGGTRLRLAMATVESGRTRIDREEVRDVAAASDLAGPVAETLAAWGERPEAAGLAVAGPVRDGRAHLTNVGWTVRADEIAARSGVARVVLANDLEAAAHGLGSLGESDWRVLQDGRPRPDGAIAVLGVGTGLGMAFGLRRGGELVVGASEGGHAPLGPSDERQDRLLAFLRRRHGRVSWERVVSGPGLVAVHEHLVAEGEAADGEALRRARGATGDAAGAIVAAAREGDAGCRGALDLFLACWGAAAAALALTVRAEAGLWLVGGISAHLVEELSAGGFLRAFRAQGRMETLARDVPVRVVTEQRLGLLGAAALAARA